MPKEEAIVQDGVVLEKLPNFSFRVELENGSKVLALPSGRIRKFNIKIVIGDKVQLEISPYDLDKGRIIYRYKQNSNTQIRRQKR